jgi:hypothetical protein
LRVLHRCIEAVCLWSAILVCVAAEWRNLTDEVKEILALHEAVDDRLLGDWDVAKHDDDDRSAPQVMGLWGPGSRVALPILGKVSMNRA